MPNKTRTKFSPIICNLRNVYIHKIKYSNFVLHQTNVDEITIQIRESTKPLNLRRINANTVISRHNAIHLRVSGGKLPKENAGAYFSIGVTTSGRWWLEGRETEDWWKKDSRSRGENKKANYLAVSYPSGWGVDMTCRETRDLPAGNPWGLLQGWNQIHRVSKNETPPYRVLSAPSHRRRDSSRRDEVTVTYGMVAGVAVL